MLCLYVRIYESVFVHSLASSKDAEVVSAAASIILKF
jgi:hypothetical protein